MLLVFACFLVIASAEKPAGYHAAIGIPTATEIKEAESRPIISRITQGSDSQLGEHPFFGGLIINLKENLVSVCGSSLLSRTRLVTAAHCWNDGVNQANQFEVVLGSLTLFSGGTRVTTTTVISHPSYDTNELKHDIAIIIIPYIYLSNKIQTINLPHGDHLNSNFAGTVAYIVGFGKYSNSESITVGQTLKKSPVYIDSNFICAEAHGDWLTDNDMCGAMYWDGGPCDGDAGGPVFFTTNNQEKILIGVMSSFLGCEERSLNVNVRVTSYVEWIESHMINQ